MEHAVASREVPRGDIGDFLRNRRAALTPERVGLPATARRRTPGLRREEVAELAGISIALYTWLEQGRDVAFSRRTIDAIAAALQLSPAERTHLFYLAFEHHAAEPCENVSSALRRMAASLPTHPLFVLDHAWDIVLQNDAASAVFLKTHDDRVNILEAVFTDPDIQVLFEDWKVGAQGLLEMFRLDYALYTEDPHVAGLVERLRAQSPYFDELWQLYGLRTHPESPREMIHPTAGRLVLEPSSYVVSEAPSMRLLLFTPYDDETANRIRELVSRCDFPGAEHAGDFVETGSYTSLRTIDADCAAETTANIIRGNCKHLSCIF